MKEYGIKKEQMIGRMTEIIRSDEVIRVDDVNTGCGQCSGYIRHCSEGSETIVMISEAEKTATLRA